MIGLIVSSMIAAAIELFVVAKKDNNGMAYVLSSIYKWLIIIVMILTLYEII